MPDGHDFQGVFYVKEAPEIRFEDGMFHITYKTGGAHIELVLKPSTYSLTRRRANRAFEEFHDKSDVVGIKGGEQH